MLFIEVLTNEGRVKVIMEPKFENRVKKAFLEFWARTFWCNTQSRRWLKRQEFFKNITVDGTVTDVIESMVMT